MKRYLVLFQHLGEIRYTAKSPKALWTGQVDLRETVLCCLSSDDWRLVPEPKWEVREVDLPDWMPVEDWTASVGLQVAWKWVGLGADPAWPREWFEAMRDWTIPQRYVAIKLLKTKAFRSDFRRRMRDHLVTWLGTPADERKYLSPFSLRMWAGITGPHDELKANNLSRGLYEAAHSLGVGRRLDAEEAMAALEKKNRKAA